MIVSQTLFFVALVPIIIKHAGSLQGWRVRSRGLISSNLLNNLTFFKELLIFCKGFYNVKEEKGWELRVKEICSSESLKGHHSCKYQTATDDELKHKFFLETSFQNLFLQTQLRMILVKALKTVSITVRDELNRFTQSSLLSIELAADSDYNQL